MPSSWTPGLGIVGLLLVGCGSQAAEPSTTGPVMVVKLAFESPSDLGSSEVHLTNDGQERLKLGTSRVNGGAVMVSAADDGSRAARFPAFVADGEPPLAIISVSTYDENPRALDPGKADFRFGARFALDAVSSGSVADNGDNLVQFGNFSDAAQYKLQLDHGRPSCRVLGKSGEAFVEADVVVKPSAWYSVTCERDGDDVTLSLVSAVAGAQPQTWSVSAATGAVTAAAGAKGRLSIGGKSSPSGAVVPSSSDQFNGVMDDVFLEIG